MELSQKEFQIFKDFIYKKVGINITEQKKDLLISRLSQRIRLLNLRSFKEYYNYLVDNNFPKEEMVAFINRITTRKTNFFREYHHFEFLSRVVLPELIEAGKKDIRIWSAGCSSGEETYSIAMTIREFLRDVDNSYKVKILATDISHDALTAAISGIYRKEMVANIPEYMLLRYFNSGVDGNQEMLQIKDELKEIISFGELNLIHNEFKFKHNFDLIFCRNVIIYFEKKDVSALINKFYNCLTDNGYLFLGHSEFLLAFREQFSYLKNTVYQKK